MGEWHDLIDIVIMEDRLASEESKTRPHSTLAVTPNLEEALRYLQYDNVPRALGVDAICIDQKNPEERSKQVARKGEIYSKAIRVVAWLGPEEELAEGVGTIVLEPRSE